jgi:hypothetical protein
MEDIKTFWGSIRVNASTLQLPFVFDIIHWLWRIPCNASLDTQDTPPEVSEVLSRTYAQWYQMDNGDFKVYGGRVIEGLQDNQLYIAFLRKTWL